MDGALDGDDMRRRAAECRLFAKTAAPAACGNQWLKAAEEWDALAREVDAWRARFSQPDGVVPTEDGKVR
jgi:hypothetical protein